MNSYGIQKILCANVRSLPGKLDDLRVCAHTENFHVIALTETWLHPGITDVNIANFYCFRCDRSRRTGGGVAIWLRNSIIATLIPMHLYVQFLALLIVFGYI